MMQQVYSMPVKMTSQIIRAHTMAWHNTVFFCLQSVARKPLNVRLEARALSFGRRLAAIFSCAASSYLSPDSLVQLYFKSAEYFSNL